MSDRNLQVSDSGHSPTARFRAKRPAWTFGGPTWILLLLTVLPLALGAKTLFYRDLLNSHYPLKAAQAKLMAESSPESWLDLPLLDPYRGGGQPLLGNPNAVPFYPTNSFYRVADPLWALNAHIWLHWLLAPFAGYWLGRAWRLDRPGAWACGVAWATSGYVMSLLNLMNVVALAALAPALVASFVDLARSPSARRLAIAALLASLTFLSGDPVSVAIVCLLAATAWYSSARRTVSATGARWKRLWVPGSAALLGLLIAAPAWIETLRILPTSFRSLSDYPAQTTLAFSLHPLAVLDWWIPGFFGRIDATFWGRQLFDDRLPFLSSLSAGWIVVALVVAAGVQRRARSLWAWAAITLGVFLALGVNNPVVRLAVSWFDGIPLLRYPVKAWIAAALGMSLLAGVGFDRLHRGARLGVFSIFLLVLGLASAAGRALLHADSRLMDFVRRVASRTPGAFLEEEIPRWIDLWTVSTAAIVGALLIALLARRRRGALALLLLLQAASQLHLLASLVAMDDATPYRLAPAWAERLPAEAAVVHGGFRDAFGFTGIDPGAAPDPSLRWPARARFAELFHGSGAALGFRYPFVSSPEGLDSFYAVAFAKALNDLDDSQRLRILEAAGVDVLLLDRALEPAAASRVESLPVPEVQSLARDFHVYRLRRGADEATLVAGVRRAGSLAEARDALLDPSFDPQREVILPGDEPGRPAADETLHAVLIHTEAERLEIVATGSGPSHLVVQRAWLPIWRATVDGEPAEIEIANGWQMAVAVPPGRHEVRLFVDRTTSRWAFGAFFLALGIVGWLAFAKPAQVRGV